MWHRADGNGHSARAMVALIERIAGFEGPREQFDWGNVVELTRRLATN